jgi:hypothetical protein
VKRINIRYNGAMYSVGDRDYAELQKEITDAVTSGMPHWLEVHHGAGTPRPASLLITPGVSVTLVPIAEPHLDEVSSDSPPEPAR